MEEKYYNLSPIQPTDAEMAEQNCLSSKKWDLGFYNPNSDRFKKMEQGDMPQGLSTKEKWTCAQPWIQNPNGGGWIRKYSQNNGMSDEDITESWLKSQELCEDTAVQMTPQEALEMGYTHIKADGTIAERPLPMVRQLDSPACQTLMAIEKENANRGINQMTGITLPVVPKTPKIEVIDTTDTKTAGLGGKNMIMWLVVGGFVLYAYNKGLLTK